MRNIETILNIIKDRRSIYSFKENEVDLELLKEIFTYASYAPTHYMKEPWRVKLYQKESKKEFVDYILKSYQRIGMIQSTNDEKTMRMIKSMKNFLLKIPHHALVYFEKEKDPVRYEEDYAAVCAFIQNAQLAAWESGVGMLWTITPYMHDSSFYQDIGLDPEKVKIAAVMQIGYPLKVSKGKGRTAVEEWMEVVE